MNEDVKKNKNIAVIAIVVAVAVALLLVGLGYVAYEASGVDNTIKKPVINKSGIDNAKKDLLQSTAPLDSDEIKKQIDQLNEDFSKNDAEASDFSDDQVSNQALGL
jgi:predicted PurR-regulated permease PerM